MPTKTNPSFQSPKSGKGQTSSWENKPVLAQILKEAFEMVGERKCCQTLSPPSRAQCRELSVPSHGKINRFLFCLELLKTCAYVRTPLQRMDNIFKVSQIKLTKLIIFTFLFFELKRNPATFAELSWWKMTNNQLMPPKMKSNSFHDYILRLGGEQK
jgi:hypothetical protein